MTFILFQRGATSWGFQVGRLYVGINYWRFWFPKGRHKGTIHPGHWGWDTSDRS